MQANDAPWMNEELALLEESVQRFFAAELTPNIERWCRQGVVDRGFWTQAAELGLLGASTPEVYGGGGGTIAHDAVIFLAQGRTGDLGFGLGVHNIALHYVLAYGSGEQKQRWLPRLASGELIGAIAMSEPGTGSDLQSVQTSARPDGDGFVVNGSKTFITNGQTANFFLLVAKTDKSKGSKGVSLFCVETDNLAGFRRGRNLKKLGLKAQDTSELFFDEMRIPASALLGVEPGQGFYQLMQQLPWERLLIAIQAIGMIEYCLEHTLAYVKERKAFGQRIMDFQNTRFKLAEMKTRLEVGRAFVDSCIVKQLRGELDAATASMAKWWTTQVQCDVADECLQLYGGYGYMMEYPLAKQFADSRVQKIYGGTNEIMKELIARSLD